MKFGKLIEDDKVNIFLQKYCRKWGRETSSKPLSLFFFFFFWKSFFNKLYKLYLLDQLQIFWQLYLMEMLGLLIGLGLLKGFRQSLGLLKAFDRAWGYSMLSTEFGMVVFFINWSLMEFQVRSLALFILFSVIDGFRWFWMGSLHKNTQLMLEFFKGLFLVLHFSFYILMAFLMMLTVILLSMLMILLSTLNVIRHVACGNN